MNYQEIQNFILFVRDCGVKEVQIETSDTKIKVKNYDLTNNLVEKIEKPEKIQSIQTPPETSNVLATKASSVYSNEKQISENPKTKKFHTIKSPLVGTFYRRPSPDRQDLIKVGEEITKGKTICIIEAMKLFNEIESEVDGKVVKILLEDASPVEFDQPLFLIEQ